MSCTLNRFKRPIAPNFRMFSGISESKDTKCNPLDMGENPWPPGASQIFYASSLCYAVEISY